MPENNPNAYLVTDMTALLDEADIRMVAHIVKDNGTEKGGAAPTLQQFLQHQANDTFGKQASQTVNQIGTKYTIDNNALNV